VVLKAFSPSLYVIKKKKVNQILFVPAFCPFPQSKNDELLCKRFGKTKEKAQKAAVSASLRLKFNL